MYINLVSEMGFGVFSKEKYKTVRKKPVEQERKIDWDRLMFKKVVLDPNFKFIVTNGDLATFKTKQSDKQQNKSC